MSTYIGPLALPLQDYQRYGRQMILDGFGLTGQLKLQTASVVVVGAGGLGCPALQFLVSAGIGRIGIIDHDRVELSNLQRQILHNEENIGMYKAISAAQSLKRINSAVTLETTTTAVTSENALSLLGSYDIILDCTDNAPTRYLLSDAAVSLGKPLVSGAAQKYEGHMCVYNLGKEGPCYRCLFPVPPPLEASGSCEDTGILGVVTGIIGNMQALETIKILVNLNDYKPTMLLFSALGSPPFRSIRLRSKKPTCPACSSDNAAKHTDIFKNFDYTHFCGGQAPDWEKSGLIEGHPRQRITAQEFNTLLSSEKPLRIIDVRPSVEFGICQLPLSTNIPLKTLLENPTEYLSISPEIDTYVVCRLGNDSQIAAEALRAVSPTSTVQDLIGGLRAWSKQVDTNFPIY